jgi:hypothetical protein
MQTPFPDEVDVPYGLVTTRLLRGCPPWVFVLLLVLGLAPLYLWGWRKWWVSAACIALGSGVAAIAKDDPQFLSSWIGEWRLKAYYD